MLDQHLANSPYAPGTKGCWNMPEFTTEFRQTIKQVSIAYETYGVLNAQGTNVLWLCHALTGDARAADSDDHKGWWGALIGSGKVIDTLRYYVVSSNVLGGCAGSTGPGSVISDSDDVYGSSFPEVTIRDMVRVQHELAVALEINKIEAVLGGSMGGMQALEWAIMYPDFVAKSVVIAADPAFSPMGIAYNDVMRQAVISDPHYMEGDYATHGVFPDRGLRVARMLGMITYRTAHLFNERFGRDVLSEDFQVNRYLRYQGEKLAKRFDAGSYLTLLRAMDTHDVGRGRGGLNQALAIIQAELIWVGIDNDLLYPPQELQHYVDVAVQSKVNARYEHIFSPYGHDAFLIEFDQLQKIFAGVLTI